ncbi:MAG: metallophosphoesterase [bacterium]
MKRILALGALAALAVGASTVLVSAKDNHDEYRSGGDGPLTFAVFGDQPYAIDSANYTKAPPLYGNDTAELDALPAFIKAVNNDHKVQLSLFAGDIHGGKQPCTLAWNHAIAQLWSAFKDPLIYTPGDNEWTDCNKAKEGGNTKNSNGDYVDYANGNPVANLALVRQLFFATPGDTMGGHKDVVSQAQEFDPAHPSDGEYVENVMWEQGGIMFVSVNIPGGSNNDADAWFGLTLTGEQTQEQLQRTGADLRWLDKAFAQATQDHMGGLVILTQADMWDLDSVLDAPIGHHLTNYDAIIANIANNTNAFNKPVLLFNGDSHIYRSDNPLSPGGTCLTEGGVCTDTAISLADANATHTGIPTVSDNLFHRLVVHGSTFPLEYLRVSVNTKHPPAPGPNSFGPFSWERVAP